MQLDATSGLAFPNNMPLARNCDEMHTCINNQIKGNLHEASKFYLMTSSVSVSCDISVVSGDGDLTTDRCTFTSTTSTSVSADVTAASLSSVQDVSVPSLAVTVIAGSDIR